MSTLRRHQNTDLNKILTEPPDTDKHLQPSSHLQNLELPPQEELCRNTRNDHENTIMPHKTKICNEWKKEKLFRWGRRCSKISRERQDDEFTPTPPAVELNHPQSQECTVCFCRWTANRSQRHLTSARLPQRCFNHAAEMEFSEFTVICSLQSPIVANITF